MHQSSEADGQRKYDRFFARTDEEDSKGATEEHEVALRQGRGNESAELVKDALLWAEIQKMRRMRGVRQQMDSGQLPRFPLPLEEHGCLIGQGFGSV